MKIKFEELLSIAGKKSNLTGDQLSQRLIQMFCVPGVKKAKQVKGMSEVIFTLLDFNDYYSDASGDFWDLESIKEHVTKCI